MRTGVGVIPTIECLVFGQFAVQGCSVHCLVGRIGKAGLDALHFFPGQRHGAIFQLGELLFYQFPILVGTQGFHQDLDARLVLVVPVTVLVVHPQDGFQVGQQILPGNKLADQRARHRGTAQATTGPNLEAGLSVGTVNQLDTDVVNANQGRVRIGHRIHGNLELPWQVGELRIERGPLANDFTPGARIFNFLRVHTGEFIGGDVTDTVAAGLDGVHLHLGQLGKNVRHFLYGRPVQLNVLTGADVAEALVIGAHNMSQTAQLTARQ